MEQTAALSVPFVQYAAGSLAPTLHWMELHEVEDVVDMEEERCASAGNLSPMTAAKTVQQIAAVVGDG